MTILADQLLNGLTRGAEYALIAAGIALIFGVVGIVNFAHGDFYMVGAFALYLIQSWLKFPYPISAVTTVIFMALFGIVFYYGVIYRIIGKSWQVQLVATLAASITMSNLAIVLNGPLAKHVSSPFATEIVVLGPVRFAQQRLLVLVVAVVAFTTLFLILKYTKIGKAMRAMSQNRDACQVVGIPTRRIGMAAVVSGAALAGIASATIPPLYQVDPSMGTLVILKAFAAVIMGGFANVLGTIISALILGIVEALAIGYIASDYADAFVFGLMILVLFIRPGGLFGRAIRI